MTPSDFQDALNRGLISVEHRPILRDMFSILTPHELDFAFIKELLVFDNRAVKHVALSFPKLEVIYTAFSEN